MMQFINPYNFISIGKEREKAYTDTDQHSGVIEYSITTKSPLFIPNTSTMHAFIPAKEGNEDHKSYDFYSYESLEEGKFYNNEKHTPVIPGSELRGMFRNVYETLTDSCMGVLNSDARPVKRTMEVFSPALIERRSDGTFFLHKAEKCTLRIPDPRNPGKYLCTFDDYVRIPYDEGSKLYFTKHEGTRGSTTNEVRDEAHKLPADSEGYLIRGEDDNVNHKKKHCRLFMKMGSSSKPLSIEAIDSLKGVLKSYQEEEPGRYDKYQRALKCFLEGRGNDFFPVYKSEVGDLLYLAPCTYTKEMSHHTVGELAGDKKPCTTKGDRCPACDLFGMIGSDNEEALASRIRVADAVLAEGFHKENCYDPIITLEILGGPKISNSEFYLKQPDDKTDFWTYDYKISNGKESAYAAELRGRKFYWHQPDKKLPKSVEKSGQNKTVRPVKTGISFIGKVYYDRISSKQLKQLIWILNGGRTEDQVQRGEIAYKLGNGKPLGLGSVLCKVTSVSERTISIENGKLSYRDDKLEAEKLTVAGYDAVGFSLKVKKEFLIIHSLEAVSNIEGKKVSYPVTPDQRIGEEGLTEGFQWFTKNHTSTNGSNMLNKRCLMKLEEHLNTIEEESVVVEKRKEVKAELGSEQIAVVFKLDGKKVKCRTSDGTTVDLKGENGLDKFSRNELKEKFTEGTKIRVVYEGENEDGKRRWRFIDFV